MTLDRNRWLPFAACFAFCGCIGGLWLLRADTLQPESAAGEAPGSEFRPVAVADEGYVSSRTCRSCHPGEYTTWHASYHRTMTQVVTSDTMLGDFDDVRLDYHGVEYHLIRDDDVFFFVSTQRKPDGEVVQDRRPILLSTGSHHLQAYWYPTGIGRALEFFPFIWVIQEARWMPRESVFLQPTVPLHVPLGTKSDQETWQFDRRWNHSCLHCHTTHPQPGFPEADTTVAEFGISCEACHGPASEHLALNRDPMRRYLLHLNSDAADAPRDPSVVEPTRLSARASSQICGSCHSFHEPAEEFQTAMVTTGHPYRPGEDLRTTRIICRAEADERVIDECSDTPTDYIFWPDGMIRISGREYNGLIDSPCYQGDEDQGDDGSDVRGHRASFSCTSCHELHPDTAGIATRSDPELAAWTDDQLSRPHLVDGDAAPDRRTVDDTNRACLSCHAEYETPDALSAHTRHDAASAGSNCYECHMPYTSYGLLKAVRSHQISSPSARVSLDTGRPNSCNLCHLDQSLTWTADHLTRWYDQPILDPAPPLDEAWSSVPASTVWLLRGDAAQRALIAAAYGRAAPRQTVRTIAGDDLWMTSYLSQLLIDPYDAVRYIALRSLRTFEGFEDFDADVVKRPELRFGDAVRAYDRWRSQASHDGAAAGRRLALASLLGLPARVGAGSSDRPPRADMQASLYAQRDDRVVRITE